MKVVYICIVVPIVLYSEQYTTYILAICISTVYPFKAVEIPCCAIYGEGSGPIYIHSVICIGSETSIAHCYLNNTIITNHQQDVGVQCQKGQCIHYNISDIHVDVMKYIHTVTVALENSI